MKSLLKDGCASGFDDIAVRPVKAVSDILCVPLSHICNLILRHWLFPSKMKIARVCAVHNCGDRTVLGNYRPISVLPVFSKIAEQVINSKLICFLVNKRIITEHQYVFQKGRSVESALLSIMKKIIANRENRLYTLGIFLDFKKAFDSIKHNILFSKLDRYGIRGIALDLMKSYLQNRFHFVGLGNNKSSLEIKCGVPQGSILGPILLLVYINDVVNIPGTLDIILYADDTNVFFK